MNFSDELTGVLMTNLVKVKGRDVIYYIREEHLKAAKETDSKFGMTQFSEIVIIDNNLFKCRHSLEEIVDRAVTEMNREEECK